MSAVYHCQFELLTAIQHLKTWPVMLKTSSIQSGNSSSASIWWSWPTQPSTAGSRGQGKSLPKTISLIESFCNFVDACLIRTLNQSLVGSKRRRSTVYAIRQVSGMVTLDSVYSTNKTKSFRTMLGFALSGFENNRLSDVTLYQWAAENGQWCSFK